MRDSERWFAWAYGLWLFGAVAYFIPPATWNPVSHLDLTRAVVEHGTLSIDAYVDNTGDRAFSGGRWYTEKAPIASFLAIPAYALVHASHYVRGASPEYSVFSKEDVPAQRVVVNHAFQQSLYVCSLSTAGLGTALVGVLLFFVLRRRFSGEAALFGSASTVLGTPVFAYGTSFYGHGIAAALIVVAFAILLSRPDVDPGPWRLRLSGACLTAAAGCEYLALIPGFILFAFWIAHVPREGRLRQFAHLATGALVPAAITGWYHWACFGAPWRTGYAFLARPEFVRGHATGLMGLNLPTAQGFFGLLVGPRRGLFMIAPFTALGVAFGAVHAVRSRDPASRAAFVAFSVLLLANAGYYMWWGGAAAGPRHLVPVLALLSFGAAAAWESRLRWLLFGLALVSVLNVLVLAAVGIEAPDRGHLLFDYAYRRLLRGEIASLSGASNLGIRLGLPRGATLGPILVWLLLGARFLVRALPRDEGAASVPDEGRTNAASAPA